MKKDIYKIENKINNKVYIGQSNDTKRRWQEHINGYNKPSIIHSAINKYGKEAFEFSIIEKNIENYNEREKYWIAYYQSNNRNFGYNLTEGGEEPPIKYGEDNDWATIDNITFKKILQDIKDNVLSLIDISKKYEISEAYISQINRGIIPRARRYKDYAFPIRPSHLKAEEVVDNVYHDLLYTSFPIEHIAKRNKVDSNFVYYINKGERHKRININYPIRPPFSRLSYITINAIKQEIKNGIYKFSEIEKMYNVSKATVNRINQGKIYYNNKESYPLRKSNERVYHQPVSTISGETESSPAIDTQAGYKQ